MAHPLPQTLFVQRPHLFQQDDGIPAEAAALIHRKVNMCRQPGLARLRGDRRCNDRRAVAVAGIVLDDQHRPHAPLLAAHHRGEIGIVNIAALDTCIHKVHTPPKEVPVTSSVRPLSFSHAVPEFIPSDENSGTPPRSILCCGHPGGADQSCHLWTSLCAALAAAS